MFLLVLQRIFIEMIVDFFYAPVWWYTAGVVYIFKKCLALVKRGNEELAPGLWLANLFVPMFGSYDWQGRIVSFFMRLVQVFFRGWILLLWIGVVLLFGVAWLLIPLLIVCGIIMSFI
jgi:hypothetical protein